MPLCPVPGNICTNRIPVLTLFSKPYLKSRVSFVCSGADRHRVRYMARGSCELTNGQCRMVARLRVYRYWAGITLRAKLCHLAMTSSLDRLMVHLVRHIVEHEVSNLQK